jgi:hypothetical protein
MCLQTQQGKIVEVNAEWSDTILEVKKRYEAKEGVPTGEQRLIFSGKQLSDTNTLSDYYIRNESTVFVVLQLRGC